MKQERKDLIIFTLVGLLVCVLMALPTKCKAQEIGKDKYYHFYYGFFASGVTSIIHLHNKPKAPLKSKIAVAVGTAFTLGLAKEIYDTRKGGTGFNIADLTATTLGALPITIIFTIKNKRHDNKIRTTRKYY
jgi:uncharacterized protein YfiM (DUF2279 family)